MRAPLAIPRRQTQPAMTRLRLPISLPTSFRTSTNFYCVRGRRQLATKPPQTIAEYLDWKPKEAPQNVTINGHVRSVRAMKSEMFVNVGDGSTRKTLQALVPKTLEGG